MPDQTELLTFQVQKQRLSAMLESRPSVLSKQSSQSRGVSFKSLLESCLRGLEQSDGSSSAILSGSDDLQTVGNMRVSDDLLSFIEAHEGYSSTAYRGADYQNQTIGYGHVIESGESISSLTQNQAEKLLESDLSSSVASVNKEFSGTQLTQNQFDALVSFAYNLGNNIWKSAPKLVNDIKSGASAETLKQDFTQFDHCNGVELKGLYNRRLDEWSMFTSGTYNCDV